MCGCHSRQRVEDIIVTGPVEQVHRGRRRLLNTPLLSQLVRHKVMVVHAGCIIADACHGCPHAAIKVYDPYRHLRMRMHVIRRADARLHACIDKACNSCRFHETTNSSWWHKQGRVRFCKTQRVPAARQ